MTFKIVFAFAVIFLAFLTVFAARKYHWIKHLRATPQRAANWWREYKIFPKIFVVCAPVAVVAFGLGQYLGDDAGGFVEVVLIVLVMAFGLMSVTSFVAMVAGFTFTALFGSTPPVSHFDTVRDQKALGDARPSFKSEVHTALGGAGPDPAPVREFEE